MGRAGQARNFVKALVTGTLDFEFERMPYRLEGVSPRKLVALMRSEINRVFPKPRPPWYPVQLHIEPSASCTLRCPLCPTTMDALSRTRRNMSFDTFRLLMDEVGDHAVIAILWMWGEPFINGKLCEMIAYARSKNMATVTSTNGQHVQTKEEAESLVSSGLDSLIVALDGASQEVYSRYRVGGDVTKVLRCLELVRQAKDALKSDTPRVNVRTVVMKHNQHELPEIERIARRYGADMLSRKTASMPDYCGPDADELFAPDDASYQRFQYRVGKRVRLSSEQYRCRRPWSRMTVTSDGTVLSCEFDFNKTAPFGTGGRGRSFVQAWRDEAASAFRRQFLINRSVYRFCADCHYRDSGGDECTVEMIRLRP